MATDKMTPVGRIVQGHPMEEQTKGYGGKPLTTKDGRPISKWFFALAILKTDPGWPELWQAIYAEAQAGFRGGEYNRSDFSWKVVDGDAPAHNQKEGFAGNWVLRISGGFPPKCWRAGGSVLIVDKNEIKCGYYVRAYINIASNDDKGKPGVYLNPSLVELVGYGQEIIGGPDGQQVFGQAPAAQLPPGASNTPVEGPPIGTPRPGPAAGPGGMPGPGPAAGPGGMPGPGPAAGPGGMPGPGPAAGPGGMPGPGPAAGPGGMPGPGPAAGPGGMPGPDQQPAPAYDYLRPGQPAPGAGPVPVFQDPVKGVLHMTGATTWTYQQLKQAGWSEDQMVGAGYARWDIPY